MEERNERLRREITSLLGHNITLNVETVQTAPFNGDPIPFCSFSCVKTHKKKFFFVNDFFGGVCSFFPSVKTWKKYLFTPECFFSLGFTLIFFLYLDK